MNRIRKEPRRACGRKGVGFCEKSEAGKRAIRVEIYFSMLGKTMQG